ncbi:hypothetical protein ACFWOB_41935, partial [Streptomyces sp. NPDC058420]|uniref:WXG100-like domain-containing protein n=1 Tax=Streptomyces sp. NPDC058420 TaxID=3346489 RepID=UPI0036645356
MSVDMPPELAWVARLAVGQAWPKGNEDNLQALGQAWNDAAQELKGISGQLGQSGNGVLESVGGQVADEFRGFVTQLESTLPEMAESAGQLGKLGKHTAVQVEYSKYMILGQLILLAAQIAEWAFFAPEVIPLAVTGARVAVKMILRRLLISIATGIALNVGLDAAVQTIQFLKGDRTEWSTDNTVSAVISGAIGGAMGGIFFGAGSVFAPKFAHSLFGKGILGAATGLGTAGIMYGIYHSGEDEFGSSVTAGLLGALGGGGKRRFGGKGDTVQVDPVHVNLPDAIKLDLPGLVSAEKVELTDPGAFPATMKSTATADTAGLNGSRSGTGTGTGAGTATRSDTSTGEQGHTVSHTADTDTTTVHGATGDTSTPVTAQHDGGLPGFATTLTSTPGTTTSTATGPATVRTGTTETAPGRVDTGGSGSGPATGTTAASANRPSTGGGSGTATEAGRPSTVSTGPARGTGPGTAESTSAVRTETGTPPPTPTRTQTGPEAAGTTERTTATTEVAQTGATSRATATETAPVPGSVPGESHVAGPDSLTAQAVTDARTDASAATATRETAPPVAPLAAMTTTNDPGPTPPPGHHPGGGQGEAPRRPQDRTPRFVVRSAFEARRFTYQGEQVADLTVRVALRDGGGGHDTDAVWNRMADGVRQFLNEPGYHLPNGDRLHVTVLRAHPDEEAHLTVDLVGRDRAMDQRSWWADAQPVDFAHELGHQIGLRDEYRDETAPQRPAVEGSLQGDYRADAPEGLRQAGLRDRHLRLIGALVGDLGEGIGPRHIEEPTSVVRTQAAELPHDEEWARAWHAAEGHDRRHVWVDPVSDPLGAGRAPRTQAHAEPAGDEITPHAPQADTNGAHSDGTAMMTRPARARTSDIPAAAAAESSTRAQARAERSAEHPALSAVPDTAGFAELRHLSSTHVTEAEARSRYGMPAANFRKFQQIAAAHNLRIDVRPTNPTAVKWLEEGKLPKPKDIKAKSINELDVLLGAKAEHRGLIGYFQPVRPERGNLDETTWSRLEARFAQRTEEFETLAPTMDRLRAEDRFKVENGLVFGRDGRGEWQEITGDHDVFDINTPGGTRLKGGRYDEVVGEMMANDMAVMHGAHMDWEPSTPFSKGIFTKIVQSHQVGGEPLLRFRPDVNDVELVHATPEIRLTAPEPKPHSSEGASASPSGAERHLGEPGNAERRLAEPLPYSERRSVQPETDSTTQMTGEPRHTESEPTTTHDEQASARAEWRVHEVEQPLARGESTDRRAQHPFADDEVAVRLSESPLARREPPVRHGEPPLVRGESVVHRAEPAVVHDESVVHRAEPAVVRGESVVQRAEPAVVRGESVVQRAEP